MRSVMRGCRIFRIEECQNRFGSQIPYQFIFGHGTSSIPFQRTVKSTAAGLVRGFNFFEGRKRIGMEMGSEFDLRKLAGKRGKQVANLFGL